MEKIVGKKIGARLKSKHEKEGTAFHLNATVTRLEGNDRVEKVITWDGHEIAADVIVFGVGVDPASDVLQGIEFQQDGSIKVDERLQAGEALYAAGDVACFPDWRTGRKVRIEHWRTAEQHGRVAAYNMLGMNTPFRGVPFFWTMQAGLQLRYVGHADQWSEVVINGNIDNDEFIAYFIDDGKVLAACGTGRDEEMAALEELMRLDQMPSVAQLKNGEADLVERARQKKGAEYAV
jgi:NADPH-dependent 2,4-dienoyl-CoA reductase/sulfur reductase-like enzyme